MVHLSRLQLLGLVVCGLFVLGCAIFVLYGYLSPHGFMARRESPLGQVESNPEAVYETLDGARIHMNEFGGELLIVNFWASWSPFTQSDAAILRALKSEFGDRITIRAINRKEDRYTAQAYLDQIGYEEGIEYILDTTDFLYSSGGGYAMPETVIFDRTGNERDRTRGTLSRDDIRLRIAALLAE